MTIKVKFTQVEQNALPLECYHYTTIWGGQRYT